MHLFIFCASSVSGQGEEEGLVKVLAKMARRTFLQRQISDSGHARLFG